MSRGEWQRQCAGYPLEGPSDDDRAVHCEGLNSSLAAVVFMNAAMLLREHTPPRLGII
jgi:hypothetical protein